MGFSVLEQFYVLDYAGLNTYNIRSLQTGRSFPYNGGCQQVKHNYPEFTAWLHATKKQRRKFVEDKIQQMINWGSLDGCVADHTHTCTLDIPSQKQLTLEGGKEDNNMRYYDQAQNISTTGVMVQSEPETVAQRRHLQNRLQDIKYWKRENLRFAFFLDVKEPKNVRELVARIKADQFTLPAEEDDTYWASIDWRLPNQKANKAGYDAAVEKMNAAAKKVADDIEILSPEKGLEALRAFEVEDFGPTKN